MRVTHSGGLTLGININKNVIGYAVELINISIYVYMYMAFARPLRVESINAKHHTIPAVDTVKRCLNVA